jgi:hypothetical protein
MKIFTLVAVLMGSLLTHFVMAQENWPKTATTPEGAIVKLYQWQTESFEDNTLKAHAAISVMENGKSEPVFGVAWLKATTSTEGQQVLVKSIYITNIKLPGITDDDKLESIANTVEDKIPAWDIAFSQSELQTALDLNKQQNNLAGQINNTPPKVIYANVPSILVVIDGAPKLQHNDQWGLDAVVNTPYVIVKNNDNRYYLYGGKHWYTATAATGSYKMVTNVPSNLEKIESAIQDADKKNDNDQGKETDANTIYNIIVSTEPAELIQSKGEANFSPVEGTGLLYVANSENDIFMDINSQEYYVLLSGRWYHSKTLSGQWQYVASDKLPAEFAKIPKGSPKDNVLASVAGTDQANDAIADAQVPQTAKVERSKVHADVNYDGDPQFEDIDGTDMAYALNSPVSVIRWRGRYYCVDDGIWFESYNAVGPWNVCVTRPYVVALIPPRYPVYYMKYVYVYDVTPDYVYMGYTPGYLNAYVYGATVVYGTGYYYRPWYHRYYYARPYTWGFGVRYNPWFGWGFGVGFGYDWFNVNIGFGSPWYSSGYRGYCGGWWGPRVYRPSYYGPSYNYRGGYYGYNSYNVYRRSTNVTVINNNYYNTNIYRNRTGIVTRDYPRNGPDRGGRYGGQWANNGGRFNTDFNRRGDRNGFNNGFDGNGNRGGRQMTNTGNDRNFTQRNGMFNRDGQNSANGNNREWRNQGNPNTGGRIIAQPQDRNNGQGNGDINRNWRGANNPVRQSPDRVQQPQGSDPGRRFDQNGNGNTPNNRWYNRGNNNQTESRQPREMPGQPQRSFDNPSRGNYGGGGRVYQPQSQPSQPQGSFPAPRSFERREGGGGNSNFPAPRSFERRESGGNGGGGGGNFSRPSGGGRSSGGGEGRSGGGGGFGRRHN